MDAEDAPDTHGTRIDRLRFDRADLSGVEQTAEGYLRIPARVAKPGLLRYPSGTELVPESALTDAEFLRSLEGKPVTLEHPPGPLTPATVGQYRVGTVLPPVEYRDGYVWATLQIEDADAIRAVTDGGVVEVSPGYAVDLDPTPGTDPVLGAYDRVQVKRRAGNHVALTRRARGGRDIRLDLRRDSQILEDDHPMKLSNSVLLLLAALGLRADAFKTDEEAITAANAEMQAQAAKADQDKAALQKEIADLKAAIPAKEAEIASMRMRYNELLEKVESAEYVEAEMAEAQATAPDAAPEAMVKPDGTKMDSKIAARRLASFGKIRAKIKGDGALIARVDSLIDTLKIEGADKLSLPAKIKAVALRMDADLPQAESDAFYRAAIALRRDSATGTGGRTLGNTLGAPGGQRRDSEDRAVARKPIPSASELSAKRAHTA